VRNPISTPTRTAEPEQSPWSQREGVWLPSVTGGTPRRDTEERRAALFRNTAKRSLAGCSRVPGKRSVTTVVVETTLLSPLLLVHCLPHSVPLFFLFPRLPHVSGNTSSRETRRAENLLSDPSSADGGLGAKWKRAEERRRNRKQ
jgi:hypothetical protein